MNVGAIARSAAAAALVFLLAVAPGAAQICEPARFGTQAARAEQIGPAAMRLARMVEPVEAVPAEVRDHIERETAAAFAAQDRRRFTLVVQSPHFHPHQVRKHSDLILDNLERAQATSSRQLQALHLSAAVALYAELRQSLVGYFEFDRMRTPRRFDNESVRATSGAIVPTGHVLLEALQCAIRELREP